jgi:hypothetical protein
MADIDHDTDPTPAITAALVRIVGGERGVTLRSDTVLADLGVDRLARVLLVDACADGGVALDAQVAWTARTVGDLVESVESVESLKS